MTGIKQAQAALDCINNNDMPEYGYEFMQEHGEVVEKALKSYIEREQGWRTDKENMPKNDHLWIANKKGHKDFVFWCEVNSAWASGSEDFREYYEYEYIEYWMPPLRLPPTPTEQEEV